MTKKVVAPFLWFFSFKALRNNHHFSKFLQRWKKTLLEGKISEEKCLFKYL